MYRKPLFKLSNFSWPLRKFASRFPWPGNKTSQNTLSLKFLYVPSTKHKFRAYWKIDDFWLDAFDWIGHFTFLWYPLHLKKNLYDHFLPPGRILLAIYCPRWRWQSGLTPPRSILHRKPSTLKPYRAPRVPSVHPTPAPNALPSHPHHHHPHQHPTSPHHHPRFYQS